MILPPFLILVQVSAVFPKKVDLSLDPVLLPDNILPDPAVHLEWVVSVVTHEGATAFDIGTGDGSEFAFNPLVWSCDPPRGSSGGRFNAMFDKSLLILKGNFNKNYFL
jgi:hypothetical protein